MAIIYDFPTNYEEKLMKADELIEKKYIDQAICYLEDLLEKKYSEQAYNLWKKKLVTCYFLKKEFESCQALVDELLVTSSCDLAVRAHDLLIAVFTQKVEEVECVKKKHEQALGPLSVYYRSLLELMQELKAYYQAYWSDAVTSKVLKLVETRAIDEKLMILSDLQQETLSDVIGLEDIVKTYFKSQQPQLTKTMLYELLVRQGFDFEIEWCREQDIKMMTISLEELNRLYEAIQVVLLEVEKKTSISDSQLQLLQQQIIFFFQFAFPFDDLLEFKWIVPDLIVQLGIESEEKNDIIDSRRENSPIINYTKWMILQYIQSLSSIM